MFAMLENKLEQNQSAPTPFNTSLNKDTEEILLDALKTDIFDKEEDKSDTESKELKTRTINTYQEWLARKKANGLKTTGINYDRGEKTFADYAAALSDDVKREILESFDCEEDYILQQEIAALYKNRNSMSLQQFSGALRAMGLDVKRSSVHTNYIVDDKKDAAHHGGEYISGNISIYTITDPQTGAEIKIVDSNGNAEIELEEIFLNELLEGVARDIDTSNFQRIDNSFAAYSNGELSGSGGEKVKTTTETEESSSSGSNKTKITKKQFDELKKCLQEKYVQNGLSKEVAFEKAINNMERYFEISDKAKLININKTLEKIA